MPKQAINYNLPVLTWAMRMLDVNSLAFDYPETSVLDGVHFSLAPGKLLHLRGGNGRGKTTLLKLLAGLLSPLVGEITWNKQSIHTDLAAYQRNLCYVGHKTGLNLQLTVTENCYFDLHWQCNEASFRQLLAEFDLSALADKPCYQLSVGQRRRVSLLRLHIAPAALWLLDEPLAGLDAAAILRMMACFQQHLASGGMIVLTSHQHLSPDFPNVLDYCL